MTMRLTGFPNNIRNKRRDMLESGAKNLAKKTTWFISNFGIGNVLSITGDPMKHGLFIRGF